MKYILDKIKHKGFVNSIKIGCRILVFKLDTFFAVKIPWALSPRFYWNLVKLILFPTLGRKRILGIWDFKALPWDIGDPLVFVETLDVLKIKNKAEGVDVCVIYDRQSPAGNRGNFDSGINSDNARDYLLELLPLFGTCQGLGSIYQFNCRDEFRRFLKYNIGRYDFFPPLKSHLGEKYNYKGCPPILSPMQDFFKTNGYIPHLRIGNRDSGWAKWMLVNYLPKGSIAVSLSLKRTAHRVENNADPQTWLAFIDRCKIDFPEVVFIVVGLREEIFSGLRQRPNVVISKDFGTSVMEDLALIRSSILYMGTSSGVNMIAMFSDLPYLIFQMEVSNYLRHGLKPNDKFSFVLDTQNIFSAEVKVTSDLLYSEFKALYARLDKEKWLSQTAIFAQNKSNHPTTKAIDENIADRV